MPKAEHLKVWTLRITKPEYTYRIASRYSIPILMESGYQVTTVPVHVLPYLELHHYCALIIHSTCWRCSTRRRSRFRNSSRGLKWGSRIPHIRSQKLAPTAFWRHKVTYPIYPHITLVKKAIRITHRHRALPLSRYARHPRVAVTAPQSRRHLSDQGREAWALCTLAWRKDRKMDPIP